MCVGAVESVKRVVNSEKFVNEDVEPCPSILGVCPVVERTGLGSLCLSKSGGVPRMCVGVVSRSRPFPVYGRGPDPFPPPRNKRERVGYARLCWGDGVGRKSGNFREILLIKP